SAFFDKPAAVNSNSDIKIKVEPIAPPKTTYAPKIDTTHEELMAAIARGQKKAVSASAWTTLAIVAILGGAATLFLLPSAKKIEKHDEQIATLEGKIGAVDEDVQAAREFKDMVPA